MGLIADFLKKIKNVQPKVEVKVEEKPEEKLAAKPAPPKKQKRLKSLIFFILFILLAFFVANLSFSLLSKYAKREEIPSSRRSTIQPSIPAMQSQQTPTAPIPETPEVREPEPQIPKEKTPLPQLTLNGLFCSEYDSWAMINNEVVKKGDYIAGARVVAISSSEVILDFEGEKITLVLE
jgi:hypothetical protein